MQPMQQDLLANGNYAPFLAHTLTPPMLGTGGYGVPQGIGPQVGINPVGINPAFGQFGQGQFAQGLPGQANTMTSGAFGIPLGYGQPGLGQPFGAQHQFLAPQQQQQFAATIHHLAHQGATLAMLGQQIGGTLQQLAQYVTWQGVIGQQAAAVLNQVAQQCAWQAAQHRHGGLGSQAVYGPPFGQTPFGQAGGFNRPVW